MNNTILWQPFAKSAKAFFVLAFLFLSMQVTFADHCVVSTVNTNRITSDPNLYVKQLKLFTDTYKKYSKSSTALREVECLKVQFPMYLCDIQDGDLFVGRERKPFIGDAEEQHRSPHGRDFAWPAGNFRLRGKTGQNRGSAHGDDIAYARKYDSDYGRSQSRRHRRY